MKEESVRWLFFIEIMDLQKLMYQRWRAYFPSFIKFYNLFDQILDTFCAFVLICAVKSLLVVKKMLGLYCENRIPFLSLMKRKEMVEVLIIVLKKNHFIWGCFKERRMIKSQRLSGRNLDFVFVKFVRSIRGEWAVVTTNYLEGKSHWTHSNQETKFLVWLERQKIANNFLL